MRDAVYIFHVILILNISCRCSRDKNVKKNVFFGFFAHTKKYLGAFLWFRGYFYSFINVLFALHVCKQTFYLYHLFIYLEEFSNFFMHQ